MGHNSYVDEELSAKLGELVENDVLEHPTARGIARLVADGGFSVLAPDQRYVYDHYVGPHLTGHPFREALEADWEEEVRGR